jgi:hypothetical protein
MPRRIDAGNGERVRRDDAKCRRELRDLLVGPHAFHRNEDAAGGKMPRARFGERREIGECARDDDVKKRFRTVILDARDDGLDVRQRELARRLLEKRAFLVIAVEGDDAPAGPRDRDGQRRNAAAAADIEQRQAADPSGSRRCGSTASESST